MARYIDRRRLATLQTALETPNRTTYWQLQAARQLKSRGDKQDYLKDAEFSFNADADNARLTYLVSRCKRGLLSYDSCSTHELRGFCEKRNIDIKKLKYNTRSNRNAMIRLLEEADESQTFDRFDQLAAELRVHIYKHHISSFAKYDAYALPPPITQVCRFVREEAYPVFYDTCRYTYTIDPSDIESREVHVNIPSLNSSSWADLRDMRKIRALSLQALYIYEYSSDEAVEFKWDIDLGADHKKVWVRQQGPEKPTEKEQVVGDNMVARLLKQLEGKAVDSEQWFLTYQDLHKMVSSYATAVALLEA